MSDEEQAEVPKGKWMRVYEKGPAREARALPGPFKWKGEAFGRGDVAVRDPESGDLVGVWRKSEFAGVFLQASEDRDQQAQLRILLYGLMEACDRVLKERGTSPDGENVARMTSDVLERFRKRETSMPLATRTLANSLLSVLIATDASAREAEVKARREAEQGEDQDQPEGVDQDG